MNKNDIKIGMRVVPFQKTAFTQKLENSGVWRDALSKGQEYLYVIDEDKEFECFVLNDENFNDDDNGDFFNPEDFEPFNEQDIIDNAFNILKSKGVTPDMYEELWERV